MSKTSVFVKISMMFTAIYAVYSLIFVVYYIDESYQELNKRHALLGSNYLKVGRILIRHGEIIDLIARLNAGMETLDFDYYLLRKDGENIAYGNAAGTNDGVMFVDNAEEGEYTTDSYKHFVIRESGYELSVGFKTSRWFYFWRFMEHEKAFILKDIGFMSLIVLALVFYSLRDIRAILNRLSSRGSKRSEQAIALSKEALTLIQGLKGYENKINTLSEENQLLKGQVLPALQSELWSGKKPPYEFEATMVRTDINNFTTLFSKENRSEFMSVINEFFVGVTHIVSRYKGFIYEFVGDEVIYYFKEEDHSNSSAIAITAIRDINVLAEKINDRTRSEFGYDFRIKSSLSFGTLRFGELVNGFSLAGSPLIETVRILSHVHEKSENVMLFDEVINGRISFLCATREQSVVMLKGLANARRLYSYQTHVPLVHQLRQGSAEGISRVAFYRSDLDISETLQYILKHRTDLPKEHMVRLLSVYRSFHVTQEVPEIRQSFLELLDGLQADLKTDKEGRSASILATLLSTASHLFTKVSFAGRVRTRLLSCLTEQDKRIVANTLDVFSELDPSAGEAIFGSLVSHRDNRVAANLLIKDSKKNWTRKTSRRLKAMLNAKSPYYKASALYALGEIAKSIKSEDEVVFFADRELQGLIVQGVKLVVHANRMVRRQAMQSAVKANRLSDLFELAKTQHPSLTPEIIDELNSFLSQFETLQSEKSGSRLAV